MSTGRSRFGVSVGAALMLVLTGCGGGGGGSGQDDGSGAGTKPSSPTRTPSAASPSEAPGTSPSKAERPTSPTSSATADSTAEGTDDSTDDSTDVDACYDGRCELAVPEPVSIEVDDRFGVGDLRVTKVTDDTVVLRSSGAGTFLSTTLGEGGTGGLNGLGFRVKSLEGGTAVLEFFPRA
ncbi:hypothetical protein [Streptomyces sp. NPDC012510]|uniref:hypothetical protein n=1 Tax=Streptomyces sp. NPDC012510 TaxID=3364838 RepID=UPI0036EB854C